MTPRSVSRAVLLLAALTALSCGEEPGERSNESSSELTELTPGSGAQVLVSANKVLVLSSSVAGERQSREAQAVAALSPATSIEFASPEQWRSKTVQEFMSYKALIIGDAACQSGTAAFQAAVDTRATWGAIVDGDVAVISTDPTSNHTPQLVEKAIRFVLNSQYRRTGMYIALGCAYQSAPADTVVTLLEPFGTFKVQGVPGCASSGHVFTTSTPLLSDGLEDPMLIGDGCAARSVFTSYPNRNFSFVAVAQGSSGSSIPGEQLFSDFLVEPDAETFFAGTPYVLARGTSPLAAGCGMDPVPSGEECDLGDFMNGQPIMPGQDPLNSCSYSCRRNWCGDGVVDAIFGEECDEGAYNGRTQDASGNIGTCSAFCRVPNLPPPPSNPPHALCQNVTVVAEYTCGVDAYVDNGSYDPDNDLLDCTQSPAGPYPAGNTTVTLTCRDRANHTASCTGVVTVVDQVAPTVTLNGLALVAQECNRTGVYQDPGATANDICEGPLSVVRTGTVNMGQPASYGLTYSATDASGNQGSASRTVNVVDTTRPTITVVGALNQTAECGGTYTDPGATANDTCASSVPVTTSGSVNTTWPGTYNLIYSARDPSGNMGGTTSQRTVTVSDTLPPTLTLNGPATMPLECGSTFHDSGAVAHDQCVGPVIVTKTGTVDSRVLGPHTLTYSANDGRGHSASTTRTLTVRDTLAPSITVLGPLHDTFECGSAYVDPGATANDVCAGNLTSAIQATQVGNPGQPGTFSIAYSVRDPSGNTTTSAIVRTVSVNDSAPPTLSLLGPASHALECGTPHTDPGAVAQDACFGDVTNRIQRTGSVNHQVPGAYTLLYNVADPAGRSAPTLARQVNVSDTLAPSLTVLGSLNAQVECGTAYTDAGATATDVCAGNLTSAIVTSSTVNSGAPGSYAVSYSVTDPSGSTATGGRAVTVRDTQAPQIQPRSGPSAIQCNGAPYVDPGALATDACAGDLTASVTSTTNLDQTRPGTYSVTYRVADASGNVGTAVRMLTVGSCATCVNVDLDGYNLFLLEDYNGGHDVVGKVAAGGNITMTDFAVGSGLPDTNISNTLVAGGNLTLSRGAVWGDTRYGGTFSTNPSVVYPRGTVAQGNPINFAARFAELRSLSSQLDSHASNGTTTRENWGGVMMRGTSANVNVFDVNASAFNGAVLWSIDAPAGSFVVVNIRGATANFGGFGIHFSGGIDQHGVLFNFVDTTRINAQGFGFWGTVLAPYAHVNFSNGSWDGGMYAKSFTGNAEGHINPLNDREICP
ncbi:immunoglobulin-like domain-containing protein [Hyalangium sp.]|uniref:immunoglobulin-like domain-containing protein n=1 Tax=Hyalangium sp. TaxID=2028555 RepID=UPI002D3F7121|nr:immunoglobulin-like domain-containing protein [Hyalangium sp.]HYH98973.1 immunoglobulin-like domain-containing protein [Hyalangium sp.]